jgi:hypothetical protein
VLEHEARERVDAAASSGSIESDSARLGARPRAQRTPIDEPERILSRRHRPAFAEDGGYVRLFVFGDIAVFSDVALHTLPGSQGIAVLLRRIAQELQPRGSLRLFRRGEQTIDDREEVLVRQRTNSRDARVSQIAGFAAEIVDEPVDFVGQRRHRLHRLERRGTNIRRGVAHQLEHNSALCRRERARL